METIIRDKLVTFLEENYMINNFHHGFHNKRSCLTNFLDYCNDLFNLYDETEAVDDIYIDFKKVFVKVPHKRLLKKIRIALHSMGKILNGLKIHCPQVDLPRLLFGVGFSDFYSDASNV